MNFRFGVVVLFGLAALLAGCGGGMATAGAGGGGEEQAGVMSQEFEDETPDWVAELPPGEEPEQNTYTGRGLLAIVQAQEALQEENEQAAMSSYEEALQIAQEGLVEHPNNAELYRQAGVALLALDRYEEGAEMLDRAEEIYPRILVETLNPREIAWVQLVNEAFDLQEAGDLEGAIERFETAHSIYQFRPEAMINLGALYAQTEQNERSIDMYRQAIDVIEGEWGERADEETLAQWEEQLGMARSNLAQILLLEERWEEAADAFETVVEENPDDLQALSSFGAALVGADRMAEADAVFADLLARPGLNASDLYAVAVGLYRAENFEQAVNAFEAAEERVPEHQDIVYNLAQTLYVAERWEELVPAARRLVEVDPLNANAYTFLAQALIRTEQEDAGLQVLDEREALTYVMEAIGLQLAGEQIVAAGQIMNRSAPAGTTVDLRIHFYDVEGTLLASEDTSVELGPEGESVVFQVAAPDDDTLFGYRYEEIS